MVRVAAIFLVLIVAAESSTTSDSADLEGTCPSTNTVSMLQRSIELVEKSGKAMEVVSTASEECPRSGKCSWSPNYPSEYANDQYCKVQVSSPTAFELTNFHTELDYDFLSLGNNEGTYISGTLQDNSDYSEFTATGPIEWFTDSSEVRTGWKLCEKAETAVGWNHRPLAFVDNLESPFPIVDCTQLNDDNGTPLPDNVRDALASAHKTQCVQVFGVLIAGTVGADSNMMRYGANILAHLLDADCDGKVDDTRITDALNKFTNPQDAPWFNYGSNENEENGAVNEIVPGYGFSSQVWKASDNRKHQPMIVLEEAFHMVHQKAWAKVYPETIGFKQLGHDGQSLACQCMREAQCKWYQHPENGGCTDIDGKHCRNPELYPEDDKVDSGSLPGTCSSVCLPPGNDNQCSSAECDCIEFFHKVHIAWIGNRDASYSRAQPFMDELKAQGKNQREAIEDLLNRSPRCSELLQKMKSPELKIPKKHIEETYWCGRETPSHTAAPALLQFVSADQVQPLGEAQCEGKNFNMHECKNVGCCDWSEDQCWAVVADRCDAPEAIGEWTCEKVMEPLSEYYCMKAGCCHWERDQGKCVAKQKYSCSTSVCAQ